MKPLFSLIESLVVLTVLFLPCVAFCATGSIDLPNAWQITDNSSAGGSTLNYTTNLTPQQQFEATNSTGGFHYTITARLADNFGSATESMAMIYGMGNRRFLIWWGLNGNGDLTARLEGGITYTLTTNGIGTRFYHTNEINYDGGSSKASYVVDGHVMTNGWAGSAVSFTGGQVYWGAGSSVGQGQMNFNHVLFSVLNSIVAEYDVGTVTAQNPTTEGWTLNPGIATTAANLSPDRAGGPPLEVATTPLGYLASSNVVINGQVFALSEPVQAWFEWGTDTNYGNVTPVQDLGFVTNAPLFHATLAGLLGGPDYHYRPVASNSFGILQGEDNSFNLRFIRNLNLKSLERTADSVLLHERVLVSVADFDNDGQLDFLLTGDNSSAPAVFQLRRNNGDGTFSNLTSVLTPGLAPVNGPTAWADYDNDGRLDFLIAGTTNQNGAQNYTGATIQLWRNTGSGFTNVPLPDVPALTGDETTLAWRDFDNDGRLDFMFIGRSPESIPQLIFQCWRNTGNGFEPVPISGLYVFFPGVFQWADYNNDGLADFLATGGASGGIMFDPPELWRNIGGNFTNVPVPGLTKFSVSFPSLLAFGDYDSDGWLDFMVSGFPASGLLPTASGLWRNTSNGFTNVPIPGLSDFVRGNMEWGDFNNDGRLDFIVTGRTNVISDELGIDIQLWENQPGGFMEKSLRPHPDDGVVGSDQGLRGFVYPSLVCADFNRDGRPDILISGRTYEGQGGGNTYFGPRLALNNLAVSSNQPPTAPTNLSSTVSGGRVALHWDAATDDTTPVLALTYNVRIGTTPGGCNIVSPPALADGTLTLPEIGSARNGSSTFYYLPPGTYYWSVQAVDYGFAGSPFAIEQQFTIGPLLINPMRHADGSFEFSFTNQTVLNFDVLVSTNVASSLSNWMNLGPALPLGGGLYRFTDAGALGEMQRYYLLKEQ